MLDCKAMSTPMTNQFEAIDDNTSKAVDATSI